MNGVKKNCLSCKKFRLDSVDNGVCRVNRDSAENYPVKHKNDDCARWQDCGQQYYIRVGWIKAKTTTPE